MNAMKRVVAAGAVIFAFSAAFAFPAGALKPPAPEGLWPKVTGAAELAATDQRRTQHNEKEARAFARAATLFFLFASESKFFGLPP